MSDTTANVIGTSAVGLGALSGLVFQSIGTGFFVCWVVVMLAAGLSKLWR